MPPNLQNELSIVTLSYFLLGGKLTEKRRQK